MSNDPKETPKKGVQTRVLSAGYNPSLSEGAHVPPIFMTTTFDFDSAEAMQQAFREALAGDEPSHLIYGRVQEPNGLYGRGGHC